MLLKAGDALEAAFQKWNNHRSWNFLRDTCVFPLVAPFTITACTVTTESTTVSAPSLSMAAQGDIVTGTGIRAGTYIVSIDLVPVPDTMVLSQPASAGGTVDLTFYRRDYSAPSNFKFIYDMRNPGTGTMLGPIDSRTYDSSDPLQLTVDEPFYYDPHPVGATGKFRFLPTPMARYMIEAKYYRRMSVPSSDSDVLDVPIDFEWGILAEAKAIFLAEKGGYDALAAYWERKADRALKDAERSDQRHPDAVPQFLPSGRYGDMGDSTGGMSGPMDFDGWGWDYGDNYG